MKQKNRIPIAKAYQSPAESPEDVGIPGLFPVGQWDIDEEMLNNEALREHRREQERDV
jgi:hypothetical protein